jgi:hypothetical protein
MSREAHGERRGNVKGIMWVSGGIMNGTPTPKGIVCMEMVRPLTTVDDSGVGVPFIIPPLTHMDAHGSKRPRQCSRGQIHHARDLSSSSPNPYYKSKKITPTHHFPNY